MRAVDLIIKKRNGERLSTSEISFFINGCVTGAIPDYQVSAFLMAVCLKGMTFEETACLTEAMLASGRTVSLAGLTGPFCDKHSTGGVGDKVSLILAPLAAACGVKVPSLCGRGLGHTGGTVDKLEAIDGYRTDLNEAEIRRVLEECGFVFMAQTDEIAPADLILYALRDVTGTIESIPLITASILSKKAAEGSEGFVFDVKTGRGAFMKTEAEARALAESLVKTAAGLGRKARAVVTAMDEPLGRMVGNLAEIKETVESLNGKMSDDLAEVAFCLGARLLILAGRARTVGEGEAALRRVLADGSAFQLFLKNVAAQGGNPESVADPERIALARQRTAVTAERDGYVTQLDAYHIGSAAVLLGAGRVEKASRILPRTGIELFKKRGDAVKRGDELCVLYSEETAPPAEAAALVRSAYAIGPDRPSARPLVLYETDAP